MTVMKTAESFQATYIATSAPKTVSLLNENQDDLWQEFQESNLHCLYSRICILWLSSTGNKSILEALRGMVTMQWRFLPFWRGCWIIKEEYYCQMKRIMIGKLWNIKQMHQRKIVNIAALFFQNKSNLVPSIPRELKQWHCGCVWGGQ